MKHSSEMEHYEGAQSWVTEETLEIAASGENRSAMYTKSPSSIDLE